MLDSCRNRPAPLRPQAGQYRAGQLDGADQVGVQRMVQLLVAEFLGPHP